MGVRDLMSPRDAFLMYVDVGEPTECWPWLGGKVGVGYGAYFWEGRNLGAHQVSHLLFIGPIPEGYHIDHVAARGCTRRDCVNPNHLEAVTPAENTRRALSMPDWCKRGHEIAVVGTYKKKHGRGACRACESQNAKRRYRARKASVLQTDSEVDGAGQQSCQRVAVTSEINRRNQVKRCVCGRIADWHYILRRDASGKNALPMFDLAEGTKCWAPGQGAIGNEPHVLTTK